MYKIISSGLVLCLISRCYAISATDALIATANIKGKLVYTTCVLTPPKDPASKEICATLFRQYKLSLSAIASPTPLSPNTTPSPTSWSPYDPCKDDASVFVFKNPTTQPYCPSI